MAKKISRISRLLLAALVVAGLSGCGNIEPWVKPYERDRLADPIMALDMDPVSSYYIMHVYEAREGARGGEAAGQDRRGSAGVVRGSGWNGNVDTKMGAPRFTVEEPLTPVNTADTTHHRPVEWL